MLLGTKNEKREICAFVLVKIDVELREKLQEGWYTGQWCCQLLQSVAKCRAEFYFVQRSAQQNNCEATHVMLCNSPETCLATALRDMLMRKLRSVLNRAFIRSGLDLSDPVGCLETKGTNVSFNRYTYQTPGEDSQINMTGIIVELLKNTPKSYQCGSCDPCKFYPLKVTIPENRQW